MEMAQNRAMYNEVSILPSWERLKEERQRYWQFYLKLAMDM